MSDNTILELIFIPIVAFCTWLAFKNGCNYIENIILNCFLAVQRMIFDVITFPITYLCCHNYKLFMITSLLQFISYRLSIWSLLQFYKVKKIGDFILKFIIFSIFFWNNRVNIFCNRTLFCIIMV